MGGRGVFEEGEEACNCTDEQIILSGFSICLISVWWGKKKQVSSMVIPFSTVSLLAISPLFLKQSCPGRTLVSI